MKRGDEFDDREFLATIDLLKTWEDAVPDEADLRRAEAVIARQICSLNSHGTSKVITGWFFSAVFFLVAMFLVSCPGLLSSATLRYLVVLQPEAGSFLDGSWWSIPVALMVLTAPLLLLIQPRKAR